MPFILPAIRLDRSSVLARIFTPYQLSWINAEDTLHSQNKRAYALAEKSVRIGWTFCDGFKNVRKRLRYKNRDYLFATKDYPSALEFLELCKKHAEVFNVASAIISHGEEYHKVPRLDDSGKPTGFTDEIKMGVIKFHNGSRIMAFSAHPQAMAVYGGDVGLDEFAKHPRARLLWETAQGRIAWGGDIAVWSAHDGEDTLFNEFAQEARAHLTSSQTLSPTSSPTSSNSASASSSSSSSSSSSNSSHASRITHQPHRPLWNLYYRVTMVDAIELGLLDVINRTQKKNFTPEQFLADCRALAREDEIFQQAYLCNPLGVSANHIVEWSAIERCRHDYEIERVHLESNDILHRFGEFGHYRQDARESQIEEFLLQSFPTLLSSSSSSSSSSSDSSHASRITHHGPSKSHRKYRLGFDVAASGQGDLAAIYIDQAKDDVLKLRALLTCRTEDWHFLKTVLFYFMGQLKSVHGAGDESGLGRQICWEAAAKFPSRFIKVNFASKKHDLGFALMNQFANAEKTFPKNQPDIAADFFALRKSHTGTRWIFTEGRNTLNANSHCDIAWAAALATHVHTQHFCGSMASILLDNGMIQHSDGRIVPCPPSPGSGA